DHLFHSDDDVAAGAAFARSTECDRPYAREYLRTARADRKHLAATADCGDGYYTGSVCTRGDSNTKGLFRLRFAEHAERRTSSGRVRNAVDQCQQAEHERIEIRSFRGGDCDELAGSSAPGGATDESAIGGGRGIADAISCGRSNSQAGDDPGYQTGLVHDTFPGTGPEPGGTFQAQRHALCNSWLSWQR